MSESKIDYCWEISHMEMIIDNMKRGVGSEELLDMISEVTMSLEDKLEEDDEE